MVLAQFKKDLANLQALAQKGGTYEAVSTQTQEIEEPSVEVKTIAGDRRTIARDQNHCRRSKSHRKRSKTTSKDSSSDGAICAMDS